MRVGLLLLVALALQDPELDEALRVDKLRIAAKKPLTVEERATFRAIGGQPRPPGKTREFSLTVHPVSLTGIEVTVGKDLDSALSALKEYYEFQSGGILKIATKITKPLTLNAKREDFAKLKAGSDGEQELLLASDAVELKSNAVLFVLPGDFGERGTSLWPHKSRVPQIVDIDGRHSLEYLLIPEKGDARWGGILAHEFGHLLGLDDQYEDKEAKVGRWCLMGTGYLGVTKEDAKPAPLCAICKSELGWNAAAPVEYGSSAALTLATVEDDPTAAVRIPVNRDGKETLLLEARGKQLVIWHTGGGKPIEFLAALPTGASDRLTPWSDPPFRARTTGSIDSWITDVRFEGGRAYFKVAPSGELTPLEQLRRSRVGKPIGK